MVCPLFVWQNRVIFSGIHACFGSSLRGRVDHIVETDSAEPNVSIASTGQKGGQSEINDSALMKQVSHIRLNCGMNIDKINDLRPRKKRGCPQ